MTRVRDERGAVMITAIILMTIMLAMGFSIVALVQQQQAESGKQRTRESSLNLNEGVLYGQAFVLARNWPSSTAGSAGAFPSSCLSSVTTTTKCPDRNALDAGNSQNGKANFTAADFAAGATWLTKVRDNGGSLATTYDPAQADVAQSGCPVTPCTLDSNADNKLWVQVRTLVQNRPRSIVALLQLEKFKEPFNGGGITAGSVDITNNGNHGGRPIIDNPNYPIAVRCDPPSGCLGSQPGQVTNPTPVTASGGAAMTPSQLERLKQRAIADGRYFSGCPDNDLRGAVVWVENCSTNFSGSLTTNPCTAPLSGGCINSIASPGVLIWHKGTAKFTGNDTFVGLIYMVNDSDGNPSTGLSGSSPVLEIGGGFSVYGAIAIDGQGRLDVGSNADPNVRVDKNVLNKIESYGTAGLVQNTWRELAPGS